MRKSDPGSVVLVPWPSLTAEAVLDLLRRNREHLALWVPLWEPDYLTATTQGRLLMEAEQEERAGTEAAFGVVEAGSGCLVGRVRISRIERGALESGFLGYFIDRDFCGRGFATQAVGEVTRWAFADAGLHRLGAAVMPDNHGSIRVLEKSGSRREGLSVRHLKIAGAWRDLVLFARTAED
jgi:ribosomal-protein-alanine N-acetyltransferase